MTARAPWAPIGDAVVLSGAGGGIGSALVARFIAAGTTVFAVDVDGASLDALAGTLDAPERLLRLVMDVSDPDDCARLAAAVERETGGADILVNNAGYFPVCDFEEITLEAFRRVCAINLDSVFTMSRAILPGMKTRGAGRIVNIGSGSVFKGPAKQAHYVAAKSGVIGLSRSMASALGQYGITVNVVTPGLTETPGAREIFGHDAMEERARQRPLARVQTVEDLVGVVAFLASADAAFMTGQILNVDGGSMMR